MLSADHYDPIFFQRLRRERPELWPNHHRLVRLQYDDDEATLRRLDASLEMAAAQRRAVLDRMARARRRLWPRRGRPLRRAARPDERTVPPPIVDAAPLTGVDLRVAIVAILRRHGEVSLRELHGLIHRYGYRVDGARPVQRLGDAAAYEARQGRLVRCGRGRYGPAPTGGRPDADVEQFLASRSDGPLTWAPPDDLHDPGPVDPCRRTSLERWSAGQWPPEAQLGSDFCGPPAEPCVAELAAELDFAFAATRARLAAAIDRRLGPPPSPLRPHRPRRLPPTLDDDSSTNRRRGDESDAWGPGVVWEALGDAELDALGVERVHEEEIEEQVADDPVAAKGRDDIEDVDDGG